MSTTENNKHPNNECCLSWTIFWHALSSIKIFVLSSTNIMKERLKDKVTEWWKKSDELTPIFKDGLDDGAYVSHTIE